MITCEDVHAYGEQPVAHSTPRRRFASVRGSSSGSGDILAAVTGMHVGAVRASVYGKHWWDSLVGMHLGMGCAYPAVVTWVLPLQVSRRCA